MGDAVSLSSGKGHHDENFPVASWLISARLRPAILAFYRFARSADDVADHAKAPADEKLRVLEAMRKTLVGESDSEPDALALRQVLRDACLTDQHALDLLEAFRRDVTKLRYGDWDELIDYCRYSAMPVGRFVLDVHGESHDTWPASDALCAALQIINHLQDCGKDYRSLDRVYIPQDMLSAAGLHVDVLGKEAAPAGLRTVIGSVAGRSKSLLDSARPFSSHIRDYRLALEVSVIQKLAEDLNERLMRRDPLSERVHHRPVESLGLALVASLRFMLKRRRPDERPAQFIAN